MSSLFVILHEMVWGGVELNLGDEPGDHGGRGDDTHQQLDVELGLVLVVHLQNNFCIRFGAALG
jgi:hypothetical protein